MTHEACKERTDLQFLNGLFDLLNFDFAEAFDLKQRLSSCRVDRLNNVSPHLIFAVDPKRH